MILIQPSCMSVKTHANFANWDKLLHATATHCSMLTSVWLTVNLHQSNDWQWQIEKRSSYIVWVVTRPDNYQIVSHFLVILIVHNLIFSTFLIYSWFIWEYLQVVSLEFVSFRVISAYTHDKATAMQAISIILSVSAARHSSSLCNNRNHKRNKALIEVANPSTC